MSRRRAVLGAVLVLTTVAGCGAPTNGRLLVTSGFTDQVFVLDARTGAILDSVRLDRRPGERDEPHGVAASAATGHWYATLAHGEPTLWKFESEGDRLVGRLALPTRGASRVRLSPDGGLAAVPDYWLAGGGAVSRIAMVRTHDLSLVGAPEVCAAPHDAVFSPDGTRLAVTCALGSEVVVLDASTLATTTRHRMPGGTDARPMNVAWHPDGDRFFVTLMGRGSVVAVGADGPGESWATGSRPAQLAVTPDGTTLVVANRGEASVSVIRLADGRMRRVELPGAHPHGVALDPAGRVAFVTYEGAVETRGGVVALDLRRGRVVWHTSVGVFTLGVEHLPSRRGRGEG